MRRALRKIVTRDEITQLRPDADRHPSCNRRNALGRAGITRKQQIEMSKENLEKWSAAASAVEQIRTSFNPPIRVLLGEAVDLARFTRSYWEPVKDAAGKVLRPGLAQAGSKLSPSVGSEILELQDALQTAHTDYLLTVAPAQADVRARAEFVLSEITAALEWWLDDGVDDERDKQLASLKAEHADGSMSLDSLAAELADYAALANQEAKGLEGLGGFDIALIAEAESLSRQLRERPTTPAAPENTRRALDLRNRIGTLLVDRMGQVRAAARFVFRNFPEIYREATSAFERRRRTARKNKPNPLANPGSPVTTNPITPNNGATHA